MNELNDPKFKELTTRFFWESFFGIFIFGVPAFLGLFLGKTADDYFGTGRLYTMLLLATAFVSSWVTIWFRNKRMTRMYRELREHQKNTTQST